MHCNALKQIPVAMSPNDIVCIFVCLFLVVSLSLLRANGPERKASDAGRRHWQIHLDLHWILNVVIWRVEHRRPGAVTMNSENYCEWFNANARCIVYGFKCMALSMCNTLIALSYNG